ncbi:MAG: class II fructose-bisphosphatase [Saprospiraceae bacterium]|nr:class II fructose-bisphosphatase [Saprospiraceae bacterium]
MSYRDLALEMVRVTELAAICSSFYVGKGDKEGGDGAAVDAMRHYLNTINIDGTIVIGEGEKDDAPMLYNGEKVGTGNGPEVDIAVDPVEGTTLLAKGQPNAIATIALAEKDSMLRVGSSFYMNKIIVPSAAKHAIDISKSPTENLHSIADALNKNVNALTVFVLDRPRHNTLIEELRACGVRILLNAHGDVSGGVAAALPEREIDVLFGIGGTPEAIITAAAVKALDGGMQCQRAPQSYMERKRLEEEGTDINEILTLDKLITSDNTFFAATGITSSSFLKGVQFFGKHTVTTQSIVMRSRSGTIRFIEGIHDLTKKLQGQDFQIGRMKS